MATKTVIFITGVGRGIGRSLTEKYLERQNHIVIGSVRGATDPKHDSLKTLPTAEGSSLMLVSIESTSTIDAKRVVKELEAAGVTHIDVVIANAGTLTTPSGPDTVEPEDILACFEVNTLAPILLYQSLKPLLEKSSKPMWTTISSSMASIGGIGEFGSSFVTAYGISKAAVNWFTGAIHASNPKWIAFALHPGHVQTDMGKVGARALGISEAPTTLDDCTTKSIAVLDSATRESTSGKLIDALQGTSMPW